MSIVSQFISSGVVKYGDFTLKSGANSKIYFDLRSILSNPKLTHNIMYQMRNIMYKYCSDLNYENTCFVGVPTGAVPIAAIIAHSMSYPIAMVRDAPKEHGLGKQIEGSEAPNVILIEDVITTGGSVEKYAEILEVAGRKIVLIACVLDRESGGVAKLQKNYRVISMVKISDFAYPPVIQRFLDYRNAKKSNLVVALDHTNPNENVRIAELVAPYVAAFKLHYDLYQFKEVFGTRTAPDFVNDMRLLKEKYNFAIIEDRKFADIAVISLKQWHALPEEYREIIDAVTVHPICGPDVVKVLSKEVGLLLIHQLSTASNLISQYYSDCVEEIAKQSENVVGFISQSRIMEGGYPIHPYLTFAPGVNLSAKTDDQGQQWSNFKNADFLIVGRGITEADNPAVTAELYRDNFWKYC